MPAGSDGLIDDISVLISNSFYGVSPITGAAGLPTWWPDGRNSIIQFCPPGSQYLIDFAANFTNKRVGYRLLYNGEWFEIATATPPQEFDLPLASGFSNGGGGNSLYWKDQFNQVHFLVSVTNQNSLSSGDVIATLPAGFRPSKTAIFVLGSLVSAVRKTGSLNVKSDGSIVYFGDPLSSGAVSFGTGVFVAAG